MIFFSVIKSSQDVSHSAGDISNLTMHNSIDCPDLHDHPSDDREHNQNRPTNSLQLHSALAANVVPNTHLHSVLSDGEVEMLHVWRWRNSLHGQQGKHL